MSTSSTSVNLFWKSLFGGLPSAEKLEQKEDQLIADKKRYNELKQSEKLKRYQELTAKKDEFARKKKELNAMSYKNSDLFAKEKRYNTLRKSGLIKTYFKVKDSDKLRLYEKLNDSDKLAKYQNFKKKYDEAKASGGEKDFKKSEDFNQYKELANDPEIKTYKKFVKSGKFQKYQQALKSSELKDLQKLEGYLQSDDFKKEKAYLQTKDKFSLTDEYKEEQELKALEGDEDIKWFLTKDEKSFDWMDNWELVFHDDFGDSGLNKEQWITQYYQGYKQINGSYSHVNDKHFPTDGKNLEVAQSTLKIITKKEQVEGKAWDPLKGFYPATFKYTTGVVNTGHVFKQKHGLFQAKIRFDSAKPVIHGFYLSAEGMVPHIDIAKFSYADKALNVNLFNANGKGINQHNGTVKGIKPAEKYYIYSLEWTPEKLTWKVNGAVVKEQERELPDVPMFISLGSGVSEDTENPQLPASMEVDWVKAFKAVNTK